MSTETLELAPEQPGEAPMRQLAPFDAQRQEAEKLKKTAETLIVTSVTDKAGMKLARETRLALKGVRVSIEHRRKELVEESVRQQQSINKASNELKDMIEPLETRLLDQEQFAEREEAKELAAKIQRRTEQLVKFWNPGLPLPDLGALTVEQFDTVLADAETTHNAKIEAAKKAEEARIAQAKADAEERERIRVENERLKKEASEREAQAKKEREEAASKLKAEQDRAAKEKAAIEDKARQEAIAASKSREEEQRKFEAEAKKQRDEAEKQRLQMEHLAAIERKKAEDAQRKEREAREKAEAELKSKRDAEETKRKADETAAKKAAKAPDKKKLLAFSEMVGTIQLPEFSTPEGKALVGDINDRINALSKWLEAQAQSL